MYISTESHQNLQLQILTENQRRETSIEIIENPHHKNTFLKKGNK